MSTIEERELIEVRCPDDDTWQAAEVIDLLSAQFTAELWDRRVLYFFYVDEDDSWRTVEGPLDPDCEQLELPLEGGDVCHQE